MSKLDIQCVIGFLAIIIGVAICCFIGAGICELLIKIDNKRFNNLLKNNPLIQDNITLYKLYIDKGADYYSDNISPLEREIDSIREKIPNATIKEYEFYSEQIEQLKVELKPFENKYRDYKAKQKQYIANIAELAKDCDKKEKELLKKHGWI